MKNQISIVIPTFNGETQLRDCLQSLEGCEGSILVVDSGSTDRSVQTAKSYCVDVLEIPHHEFNHGATREYARKQLESEVVVFLTQDVLLTNPNVISLLVKPILEGKAQVSYGRQLPKPHAGFFERFPRNFNYPSEGQLRSLEDKVNYGAYTFFCSDSFAAYSQKALNDVGGFEPTLSHEDYFAVAKVLRQGGRIAYVAEAEVFHSHAYSLVQEFRRYFDAGYVRAVNPWVSKLVGQAENHGTRYLNCMVSHLWSEAPLLIPYGIIQSIIKWIGYRTGYFSFRAPTWLKKFCSGQSYFFDSSYYIPGKN